MTGALGVFLETAMSTLWEAVTGRTLSEAATNLLNEKVDVILNAKDDPKNFEEKLKFYQNVIKDAHRKPFLSSDRDRELEGDLKDILYDAEDIIEAYRSKTELSKKDKGSTSTNEVSKKDKDNVSEHRSLLEALEPPHGIERLRICDYKGDRPAWYLDTNYVELRTLQLRNCQLLATVIGIKSLEKLEVNICPTLCELPSMPLLKSLEVNGCDGLKTLTNMPTLESLKVDECGSLEQVAEMPALTSLKVYRCNMLKNLANMPALELLTVITCRSLKQVPKVPTLRSLWVEGCNIAEDSC